MVICDKVLFFICDEKKCFNSGSSFVNLTSELCISQRCLLWKRSIFSFHGYTWYDVSFILQASQSFHGDIECKACHWLINNSRGNNRQIVRSDLGWLKAFGELMQGSLETRSPSCGCDWHNDAWRQRKQRQMFPLGMNMPEALSTGMHVTVAYMDQEQCNYSLQYSSQGTN